MSPENEAKLVAIDPDLFPKNPRIPVSIFGFECGDGWFDLLKDCISGVSKIRKDQDLEVKVFQIKEKFGTLQFYMDGSTKEMDRIIDQAQAKSSLTCEKCSRAAKTTRIKGWCLTHCEQCLQNIS